jgi:hypothetical protein
MNMGQSGGKRRITDSERANMQEMLIKGSPLFVEVTEIVFEDTIAGLLVLGAFGAPPDTKVHVKQAYTHTHIDSLARHIKGSDYMSPLRPGDIVSFDRVFLDNGDAVAASISSRTHDGMRGNVQFLTGLARVSSTSVSKRGAQQTLTLVDGTNAFNAVSGEEVTKVYNHIRQFDWAQGGNCGFIVRTSRGQSFEYIVGKDNPLAAFLEDLDATGKFDDGNWIELIPAVNFPVAEAQIKRDIPDLAKVSSKATGIVGRQYSLPKSAYAGFRPTGIILCDEEEWAFGGKTGKIRRVAGGIQPLYPAAPLDRKAVPTRIQPRLTASGPMSVDSLYSPETMARMAAERDAMRPTEDRGRTSAVNHSPRDRGLAPRYHEDYRDGPDEPARKRHSAVPFKF